MRDEKTYCIDIRDVKTRTLVMPYHRILALTVARSQATVSCCRSTGSTEGRRGIPLLRRSPLNPTIRTWAAMAIATAWKAHRTCSWSATRTTSKFSPSSRSRRSLGRRSSTSSVLYTLSASYKFLTTINSQIAIVSDCPLLAPSSPVLSYIDPTSRHDRPNYLLTRRQHLGSPSMSRSASTSSTSTTPATGRRRRTRKRPSPPSPPTCTSTISTWRGSWSSAAPFCTAAATCCAWVKGRVVSGRPRGTARVSCWWPTRGDS